MKRTSVVAGFSTVELLITLFVAAVFLAAGYQLYLVTVRDSGDVRQRARASAIAYDYLRRNAATVPTICSSATSTPIEITPAPEGLARAKVSVSRSCAQSGLSNLSRIEVTVRYNHDSAPGDKDVTHAIYATP
jgi:Tfp pilus assembly protein PilV